MTGFIRRVTQNIIQHWWLISLLCLLATLILSLIPAPILPPVPNSDKTHHLIAYMAISLPIALAKPKHWQVLLIGVVAISGAIELIQPFVNRYGEWLDLLANAAGVVLAIVMGTICRWAFWTK